MVPLYVKAETRLPPRFKSVRARQNAPAAQHLYFTRFGRFCQQKAPVNFSILHDFYTFFSACLLLRLKYSNFNTWRAVLQGSVTVLPKKRAANIHLPFAEPLLGQPMKKKEAFPCSKNQPGAAGRSAAGLAGEPPPLLRRPVRAPDGAGRQPHTPAHRLQHPSG